jgi:hypothetical protein
MTPSHLNDNLKCQIISNWKKSYVIEKLFARITSLISWVVDLDAKWKSYKPPNIWDS